MNTPSAGPTLEECRRSVVALHEFFVDWYTGKDVPFDHLEATLAEDFDLVSPEGEVLDRESVVESVRNSADQYFDGGFDIDIRNVSVVSSTEQLAVVRYEEWQSTPKDETVRVSTAVLRPDESAPDDLSWLSVQETWLDEPATS